MRKRELDVVRGKVGKEQDGKQGQPMCVRPYQSDEKKLQEIARETGEGKAAIVRRMISFALSDKQQNFAANQCRDRLDWLIKNVRGDAGVSPVADPRKEEILERIGSLENMIETLVDILPALNHFLREIYCLSSISFSSQNLIFTRLLEFASPSAEERQQSAILAAAALANQIAQAVKDLSEFEAFYKIDSDADRPSDLHLLTKVRAIRDLIAAYSSGTSEGRTGPK